MRLLTSSIVLVLIVVGLQNLLNYQVRTQVGSAAGLNTVEFGWPCGAIIGDISVDQSLELTLPLQFFRSMSQVRIETMGCLINLLVATVFCVSASRFAYWLKTTSARSFSLLVLLKIFVFVAVLAESNARELRLLSATSKVFLELDSQDILIRYINNSAWALVFISCLDLDYYGRIFNRMFQRVRSLLSSPSSGDVGVTSDDTTKPPAE